MPEKNDSKPEAKGRQEMSLEVAERSFRFLKRWMTRRIGEAYEFRYSLTTVLTELNSRREKSPEKNAEKTRQIIKKWNEMGREGKETFTKKLAEELATQPKTSVKESLGKENKTGIRFFWVAGPTPKGTQSQIDAVLTDTFGVSQECLEAGVIPVVQSVGIEAHVGRSAVGLEFYKGRILWADLQYRLPFWTLRRGEGNQISCVVNVLARWLSTSIPPAMEGLSRDQVREKLVKALYILRVNPYTHNFDFAMLAAREMERARDRLDEAVRLLNRWAILG